MDILKEYDSTMAIGGMDEAFLKYDLVHPLEAPTKTEHLSVSHNIAKTMKWMPKNVYR
jgi:hypothetical protein